MRNLSYALIAIAMVCSGCASVVPVPTAPAAPESLVFIGRLDLSGQGVGFLITHATELSCTGRYASGHLPDPVSVEVTCNDNRTGILTVTKTAGMHGDVVLSDETKGIVSFEQPPDASTKTVASRKTYVRHGRWPAADIGRTTCRAEKALHWHWLDENRIDVQNKLSNA